MCQRGFLQAGVLWALSSMFTNHQHLQFQGLRHTHLSNGPAAHKGSERLGRPMVAETQAETRHPAR